MKTWCRLYSYHWLSTRSHSFCITENVDLKSFWVFYACVRNNLCYLHSNCMTMFICIFHEKDLCFKMQQLNLKFIIDFTWKNVLLLFQDNTMLHIMIKKQQTQNLSLFYFSKVKLTRLKSYCMFYNPSIITISGQAGYTYN